MRTQKITNTSLVVGLVLVLALGWVEKSRPAIESEEEVTSTPTEKAKARSAGVSLAEATKFVNRYYAAFSESDVPPMLKQLAPTVDYKDAGWKDHMFIRDKLRDYIKRWPVRTFKSEHIQVAAMPDGSTALTFNVAYTLADETTQKSGNIATTWGVHRVEGDLEIFSLKEKAMTDLSAASDKRNLPLEPGPHEVDQLNKKDSSNWADNARQRGKPSIEITLPATKQKTATAVTSPAPVFTAKSTGLATPKAAPVDSALPQKHTDTDFTLAVDIGHSPLKGGAVSARGVFEYEFNRRMVGELFRQVQISGLIHSFIVNPERKEISLLRRSAVANAGDADLFLSIHHDSVKDRFLKDWEVNGETQKYCDDFHGYSVFFSRKNSKPEESLAFAMLLGRSLLAAGFTPTLHHVEQENRPIIDKEKGVYAFDDLVVLKNAEMPAVLLECGVIVNRVEEAKLNDPAYRKRLVDAVNSAIQTFAVKSATGSKRE